MTTNELIHALVINKYGLNPDYLSNSQMENPDGTSDKERCIKLIDEAGDLKVTFVADFIDVANSVVVTNQMKTISSKRPSVISEM